jgi:hypothetical protein
MDKKNLTQNWSQLAIYADVIVGAIALITFFMKAMSSNKELGAFGTILFVVGAIVLLALHFLGMRGFKLAAISQTPHYLGLAGAVVGILIALRLTWLFGIVMALVLFAAAFMIYTAMQGANVRATSATKTAKVAVGKEKEAKGATKANKK